MPQTSQDDRPHARPFGMNNGTFFGNDFAIDGTAASAAENIAAVVFGEIWVLSTDRPARAALQLYYSLSRSGESYQKRSFPPAQWWPRPFCS
jgi:hypothetical protein